MNPEQHADGTPPQVRVASYSNTTWQGSWRQRSRAVWGTGLFGMLWGSAVGGVLAATLFGIGALTAATGIPVLVLGCAAAGGGIGMSIGDSVGTAAGAVGSGMAEWESRFKQMMVEAGLFDKTMVTKEPISSTLNRTEVIDTPEEVNQRGHMFGKLINWPAMATFVTLGVVLGAALGYAGLFTAPLGVAGIVVGPLASAVLGAVLVGGTASVFGVNSPVISNNFNSIFSKVFSGEMFGTPKKPEMFVPTPVADAAPETPLSTREELVLQQAQAVKKNSTAEETPQAATHQERVVRQRLLQPANLQLD